MSNIRITSGRTGKKFLVKVFDTFSIDLDMPVTPFKIPQQDSSNAQLIKVEGNFKTITLSWLMNDDGTDVSEGTDSIVTVEQQRDYLETQFETFNVEDASDTIEVVGSVPANVKTGKLSKILISLDAMEPNNYRATVTLYVGETIETAEDN